jgi:putative polyketide hydroxylase
MACPMSVSSTLLADVVVVGAGPAGLSAAIVLAREGARVVVLDRRQAVSDLPRAVGISLRQMEVFRTWGLERELRDGAADVELAILQVETVSSAREGRPVVINVPSRTQSEVVSPTSPARVPQDHLERVLADYLSTFPNATLLRGRRAVDVIEQDDSVTAVVADESSGEIGRITASFLIGADGARSDVRAACSIEMSGPEVAMSGVSVEFTAPIWDVLGEHRYALYSVSAPAGAGVLIPAGPGDRWQYGVVVNEDVDADAMADPELLLHRIRAAVGMDALPVDIVRVHRFGSGAQVADRFRRGRVVLVGDAAHRVTPRGGNGLAMAVRDGLDLGWRLSWVVAGWVSMAFLDTYETEGRPIVEDNVARASDPTAGCRAVISEMQLDLGGRLEHVWVAAGLSTHDLLGPGLTLLTAGEHERWATSATSADVRVPIAVRELPPLAAHALGLNRAGGAMLVRPDAVPVARWWAAVDATGQLETAVRAVVGSPGPPASQAPREALVPQGGAS